MSAMRIDPFSLPREKSLRETKEFTVAGQPFSLTLEEPNAVTLTETRALRDAMIARYINGSDLAPAFPFCIDGEEIALTPDFIAEIATVVTMQPREAVLGYPPYQWEELATLAIKRHREWRTISEFALRILNGVGEALPNEPGAPTGSSSAERSNTDTSTPSFAVAGTPP